MNLLGKLLVKLGAEAPSRGPEDDFWYRPTPGLPGSRYMSSSTALRVGTVWACVRVISETLGSLPFKVYRRVENGKLEDPSHPLYRLIHDSPNPAMTAMEFWKLAAQRICTHGNFYARIVMDEREVVRSLRPLDPSRMRVIRDPMTELLVYVYTPQGGPSVPYLADEVLHIPGLGYDGEDNLTGLDPIAIHAQSLGLTLDAEGYASRFFANNANHGTWLQASQNMSTEKKREFLQWFMDNFGGVKNSGKPAILDNGFELKSLPVNHQHMQFIETRKYQVEEICRIFRVPPHLVQDLARSTNNNIEHQAIDFVTHTIRPWAEMIEQRINMSLFGPREGARYFAEFNLDSILRGDAVSRAEYYGKRIANGNMTPNEARVRENDNPLPGGDRLYIQGAMVPLEMAGQQQGQEQPQ